MTRLVPVRDVAPRRLLLPGNDGWTTALDWVPVATTEIHLACRHFPVAVRFEDDRPRLGLIVGQRYLNHALLDSSGRWRGAYRPVGLRCFPFQAAHIGDDPLSDILIDDNCEYLSSTGTALVDSGRPTKFVTDLHKLFSLLKRSQETFAGVLDQLLIAGLLVPLEGTAEPAAPLHVIDRERLSQLKGPSLAAMARHGFLSVDVAVAAGFSLQNLSAPYRPKAATGSRQQPAPPANAPDLVAIDDLSLALDDSELIPLWNIAGLGTETRAG
jgi:hypothetical protein